MVSDKTECVRQLNDAFRQSFSGGRVLLTQGIRAFPEADIAAITAAVQAFTAFSEENDPGGKHDFGSFRYDGQLIYWKIDCYDKSMDWGSADPADPAVTTRVLTILLAAEY
jgi:hypothetical protein